jgi:hypothetical protein
VEGSRLAMRVRLGLMFQKLPAQQVQHRACGRNPVPSFARWIFKNLDGIGKMGLSAFVENGEEVS